MYKMYVVFYWLSRGRGHTFICNKYVIRQLDGRKTLLASVLRAKKIVRKLNKSKRWIDKIHAFQILKNDSEIYFSRINFRYRLFKNNDLHELYS